MNPDFNTLDIGVNPDSDTLDVGVNPDSDTLDIGVNPEIEQNELEKYLEFISQKQCMAPMFLTRTIYFSPVSYLLFYPSDITSLCAN